MTYTLAAATRSLAEILGGTQEGTATGGGATTLVDANFWQGSAIAPADSLNQGTIWFISGDEAGNTNIITDWDGATTITFPTMSTGASTGDRYAFALNEYPRWVLRQSINKALGYIYSREAENTATTSVADQMDYSLPAGVYNVIKAEVATSTSAPYNYKILTGWHEIGTTLSFDEDAQITVDGYTVRLTYIVPPSELTADTDTIADMIHLERLKWEAAVHAFRWKAEQTQGDPWVVQRLAEAMVQARSMRYMHPIIKQGAAPALPGFYGVDANAYDFVANKARY